MTTAILAMEASGRVLIGTDGYIKDWSAFQRVISSSGAQWNRRRGEDSRYSVSVDSLPALIVDLKAIGIDATCDEAVSAALKAATESGWTTPELAAKKLIEVREERFKERGLSLWKPFQLDGAIFLAARDRALLGDEVGCVDGEAIVRINRAGRGYAIKLSDLHHRFNGGSPRGGKRWDLSIPTRIRSLCGGELRLNEVMAVVDKGVRPVLLITLSDGKTLRLTGDHEVRLSDGRWEQARLLKVGDLITTNGTPVCDCGSTENVSTYAYAKFSGSCRKCIYRKLRRNHTFKTGKWVDADGYIRVSGMQDHPRASDGGSVYEHILVMEKHLGRPVGRNEAIHHKNQVKSDNRLENLELTTHSEHAAEHGRSGGYRKMNGGFGGKGGEVLFLPKSSPVVSVKPDGKAHVYDVVCADPHRNFVANGIVVHNCGKTIIFLAALQEAAAVVVVCPATILVNWARETRRWRPDLRPVILAKMSRRDAASLAADGIGVESEHRWPAAGEILIVNYESMLVASDVMGKRDKKGENGDSTGEVEEYVAIERTVDGAPLPGTVLVSDELHRVKNPKTKMASKWNTLRDAVKAAHGRIYGMTGTPIYNRPPDLANVLRAIGCFNDVFVSWNDFKRRMGGYDNGYGLDWTGDVDPSVPVSMRRVMLRREKKDVMKELPPLTTQDVEVDAGPALTKLCDEIVAELIAKKLGDAAVEMAQAEIDAIREQILDSLELETIPFNMISRLHALMSEVGLGAAIDMIDDLEDAGEPVVVFSQHRKQIERLEKRDGWEMIVGGVDPMERSKIVDRYQRGELKGVACTIGAAREGITLTRGCNTIFCSFSWSPSDNEQAAGRVHRGTQTRPVLCRKIVPNHPLTKRICELLLWKQGISDQAIGAASIVDSLAAERRSQAEKALGSVRMLNTDGAGESPTGSLDAGVDAADVSPGKTHERSQSSVAQVGPIPPSTPLGRWICESLVRLDSANSDNARIRNDVGFNAYDTMFGRSLATTVRARGGLTVNQYRAALKMLRKYQNTQIGRAPATDAEIEAALKEAS